MNLIRLPIFPRLIHGEQRFVYVNADYIAVFRETNVCTEIVLSHGLTYTIDSTPEKIIAAIMIGEEKPK